VEQVIVTVHDGTRALYERVTAWLHVNTPKNWRGHFIAAQGVPLVTSGLEPHLAEFVLATVDGRGGKIIITHADTQTREVRFEGAGTFGVFPKAV
jgi:hypothetical protein